MSKDNHHDDVTVELRLDDGETADLLRDSNVIQAAIDAASNWASQRLNREKVLTQVLETNIHLLETLRHDIEDRGRKDVEDVRDFGGPGASLLRGVDVPIGYDDLAMLVLEMKQGVARRRVALEQA